MVVVVFFFFSDLWFCLLFGTCSLCASEDLKKKKKDKIISWCRSFFFLQSLLGGSGETQRGKQSPPKQFLHYSQTFITLTFSCFSPCLKFLFWHCWCWRLLLLRNSDVENRWLGNTWEMMICKANFLLEMSCHLAIPVSFLLEELQLPGQLLFLWHAFLFGNKQSRKQLKNDVLTAKSFLSSGNTTSFLLGWVSENWESRYKWDLKFLCFFLIFFFRTETTNSKSPAIRKGNRGIT